MKKFARAVMVLLLLVIGTAEVLPAIAQYLPPPPPRRYARGRYRRPVYRRHFRPHPHYRHYRAHRHY